MVYYTWLNAATKVTATVQKQKYLRAHVMAGKEPRVWLSECWNSQERLGMGKDRGKRFWMSGLLAHVGRRSCSPCPYLCDITLPAQQVLSSSGPLILRATSVHWGGSSPTALSPQYPFLPTKCNAVWGLGQVQHHECN